MTPQESKEQPPKRGASFVEIVRWSMFGALLGALLFFTWIKLNPPGGPMLPPPDDEDPDRPPIIVRNGSVHVESATPGSDGDKGKFERRNGKKEWDHTHGADGPKRLTVVATGVTTSADCPTSIFTAQRVTRTTLTYTSNGTDRTVVMDIDGGNLRVTAHRDADVTETEYTLDIDDANWKLKGMTLAFKKKKGDANDTTVTCGLGADPEVIILQRR